MRRVTAVFPPGKRPVNVELRSFEGYFDVALRQLDGSWSQIGYVCETGYLAGVDAPEGADEVLKAAQQKLAQEGWGP